MTQAEKIMKQKAFIRDELDRRVPKDESARLWAQSTEALAEILARYADIPKGERAHTDRYIFPSAAIYLTLGESLGREAAYDVVEQAAIRQTTELGRKLAKLMKLPGMPALFVKVWDPMTKRMFGAKCGFRNRFYPKVKGEYRMDVLACPYCRYFTALGCPELTKIFCDNDERGYGNLPGLQFIRHTTLGKGGERCDFYIRRV